MKKFNTAGPSITEDHYMVDPLTRFDLDEVENLIDDKRYFVLHAPRQTGKTTSLFALMKYLNDQGRYRAVYANIETAQTARHHVDQGMRTICGTLEEVADMYLGDKRLHDWTQAAWAAKGEHGVLAGLLKQWSEADPRPLVLMLDEVDALVGDTLVSLLRQLRAGYGQRPASFPQSVILCGVRDVRDYRIHTSHQEIITGGSAFNIKTKSLRLGNFTQKETENLWREYELETGHAIDPAIYPELWLDTMGQPWLVNALGYELTWEDRDLRKHYDRPITLSAYQAARERLIQSRATHLDQLTYKLQEDRVRRTIAPILSGRTTEEQIPEDDLQYNEDLGLIQTRPQLRIANRIYQEVIPRVLTWTTQVMITHEQVWYVRADRQLDFPKLLTAFQQFFREHSEAWLEGFSYKEAGPQLLLQAFLQRIVNGGGRINREYGLGRKRTDLLIEWPLDENQGFFGPIQRVVIELKLLRTAPETTLVDGLLQTAAYADLVGANEAYLILFDRRPNQDWDSRIWQKSLTQGKWEIGVWGM